MGIGSGRLLLSDFVRRSIKYDGVSTGVVLQLLVGRLDGLCPPATFFVETERFLTRSGCFVPCIRIVYIQIKVVIQIRFLLEKRSKQRISFAYRYIFDTHIVRMNELRVLQSN